MGERRAFSLPRRERNRSHTIASRWRISSGQPLRWRHWDDQWLVYHPASGDTHVLDEASAQAVRRLEASPLDADALAAAVAEAMGVEASDEVRGYIAKLLPQLDVLGLIEPEP